MKKTFNGSLHFTPDESADLFLLCSRKYELSISEWKFLKKIISTYLTDDK